MSGIINDPVAALRASLRKALKKEGAQDLAEDASLAKGLRWAPHLFDRTANCAWYCLAELPQSDRWAVRMKAASQELPGLSLGVCGPMHVLKDEATLTLIDQMDATVFVAKDEDSDKTASFYASADDFIYGAKLQLSRSAAASILDRALDRCKEASDNARKGVLLEVLTAVLMSQVSGFEVHSRDVSNRSQQMDVIVHNRNTSGVLRNGEIVIAEAKNWSNPVGTTEYYSLVRKIENRHGRAKMGFFVTTDRFTEGVGREKLRDSNKDVLVITLDKDSLPPTWREGESVTKNIEATVIDATIGD